MIDLAGTKIRSNLIEWAEKAGARFHRSGHEWRSNCPLHAGDNPDAFAVYEHNGEQRWKCFTGPCGNGDIFDFVQKWQNCDLIRAYRFLGGEDDPDPQAVAAAIAEHARLATQAMQAEVERVQRSLEELRQSQSWLAYHADLEGSDKARRLWEGRGVARDWQDFWKLGVCRSFTVGTDSGPVTTPSLTIPIYDEGWQLLNVRHRLLKPPKPNDKYRPDKPGLPAAPFIANPNVGFGAERILVVEGEIKSMVAYQFLFQEEDSSPQVIGIPGKTQFRAISKRLTGHDVFICFDPDAAKQAQEAAHLIGGAKVITLPMKIDDAILARALGVADLKRIMRMARRIS